MIDVVGIECRDMQHRPEDLAHHLLDAFYAQARAAGLRGALFPWESAGTGREVTPRQVLTPDGVSLPIWTGETEDHIVADVAWAADRYASWTGDDGYLTGPAVALILDTARYWASRVSLDADGRAHLRKVIGPDEYHEGVDDNAYTNILARWNLRRGARSVGSPNGPEPEEAAAWLDLADRLVDGFDAGTGLYEQFAGFYQLEPLFIGDIADPPVAADLLLGRERVQHSQVRHNQVIPPRRRLRTTCTCPRRCWSPATRSSSSGWRAW